MDRRGGRALSRMPLRLTAERLRAEVDEATRRTLRASCQAFVASRAAIEIRPGRPLRQVLAVDGIDGWEILRAQIQITLREPLFLYYLVRRIVARERPVEIRLERPSPRLATAVRLVAAELGSAVAVEAAPGLAAEIGARAFDRALRLPGRAAKRMARAGPLRRAAERARLDLPGARGALLLAFEYIEELKMLGPVIEHLRARGGADFLYCPLDGRERLAAQPLFVRHFARHRRDRWIDVDDPAHPPGGAEDWATCGRELASLPPALFQEPASSVSLRPLIGAALERFFAPRYVLAVGRRLAVMRALIARARPRAAVAANAYGVAHRLLLHVCRQAAVPTLLLPHHTDQLDGILELGDARADAIAVMGADVRRSLVAAGVPAETVHVTGAPWFDPTFAARDRTPPASPADRRLIAFTAQGLPHEPRRLAAILDAVETRPRSDLVIRPHPKHWSLPYRLLARLRAAVWSGPNLHRLLAASDVVVTTSSMTAFDAILFGRPLIMLDEEDALPPPLPIAMGAAVPASPRAKALAEILARLESDAALVGALTEGRQRVIAGYFTPGGSAAARVAALLAALAETGGGDGDAG